MRSRPLTLPEPPRPMISRLQRLLPGLALALLVPLAVATDAELHAAVIYNIARFVQWPETVTNNEHFGICTVGGNAITEALHALTGKTLNDAPVIVRPVQPDQDLSGCQLLYIAEENVARMSTITQALASRRAATLTISDAPSFLALGGMVQLVVLNDRQRFRINQDLAEKAKLGINAKLLQLALPGID